MAKLTALRGFVLTGLVLSAFMACDTKTPTGPGEVTQLSTSTSTTTTSVPGSGGGGTSTSTTSVIPLLPTIRTYVAFGPPPTPTAPSQLTIVLQRTGGSALSTLSSYIPFLRAEADPIVWTVTGFYTTPSGGGGKVTGQLVGTLDEGSFNGSLTAEAPECTAEREFGGSVDPQFLRWTGGRTLSDCKGSPLGFSTLTMLATSAPPPTSTIGSTTTTTLPLTCSYSLSANNATIGVAGGSGSVGVITAPNCGWTVQNFVGWITVQPTTGNGAGTVTFTAAPNPTPSVPRSTTLVIAGLPFVINQGVVTTTTTSTSTSTTTTTTSSTTTTTSTVCTYTLTPPAAKYGYTGTAFSTAQFSIATSSICTWSVSTTAPWIFIQPPTAGLGPATVTYAVDCHENPAARVGIIRVGNGAFTEFTITQAGYPAGSPGCGSVGLPRKP